MRLTKKIDLQQANLAREHLAFLRLNWLVQLNWWLTTKCYLVQNQNEIGKNKYKDVSKKHNNLYFERYQYVLNVFQKTGIDSALEEEDIDRANNVGFRVYDQNIVMYKQKKLGLSGCYDKRYVLADVTHTRPLEFWQLDKIFWKLTEKQKISFELFFCSWGYRKEVRL